MTEKGEVPSTGVPPRPDSWTSAGIDTALGQKTLASADLPNPRGPALSMPPTSSGIMHMSVKTEPDIVKTEHTEETGAEDEVDEPISLSKMMIDLGLPDFLHPVVCTVLKVKGPNNTDASLITFLQAKELTYSLPKEVMAGEETVELSLMDIAAVRKWHHDV